MENFTGRVCERVMLIDDSSIDNFVNQKIIDRCGFSAETIVCTRGRKAIDHLAALKLGDTFPSLIFLDLNMPVMNGFQFLAEFNRLPELTRANCKVVILSSTVNPADMQLAMRDHTVFAFFSKPLMKGNLDKLKIMLQSEMAMSF
jgi:CheY-like chemotaxis protein